MKEGESVDDSREQHSLYGNEIEADKETVSEACTNKMHTNINSELGPGRELIRVQIPIIRQTVQQQFVRCTSMYMATIGYYIIDLLQIPTWQT